MRRKRCLRIIAWMFFIMLGLAAFAVSAQEKQKRVFIQATAEGTSTQLGQIVSVDIVIEEYSAADDQKGLLAAFQEKGNEGLANALDKMHSKGRIRITGTLGYDINYVRQFKLPDGTTKIRLVTDRPITFGEAWSSSRSMDYSLSGAEIIISTEKGKSHGTLLPACEFKLDKEKELQIETLQNPWKLLNVQLR